MIHVCTVAAAARAAEVRVLAHSIAGALPAARFLWVVCGPFDQATLGGLDGGEIASMSAVCPPRREPATRSRSKAAGSDPEVATPDVALSLLRRPGCDGVLFVAPQVVLFSSVPELFTGAPGADVVLVPSVISPEALAASDLPASELRSLRLGVFSTSLVAVTPTPNAERFLRWWSDRAHTVAAPPGNRHELRPWLNLAPALFAGIRVLRSPRYAVGRENLPERHVEGNPEDGITVDGTPLACFDFAGLADGSLEAAITDSRGDRQALESLVRWYRDRCRAARAGVTPPARASTRRSS